jgi:hypothetical protein
MACELDVTVQVLDDFRGWQCLRPVSHENHVLCGLTMLSYSPDASLLVCSRICSEYW